MSSKVASFLAKASATALCAMLFVKPVHAESLLEAMNSALAYHPSVEAAVANRHAFESAEKEEFSGYFPELNIRGAGGRVFGDNSTSRGLSVTRGAGYSYLWEGSVTLTQMIFDGFETSARVDAAEARLNAADLDLMDIRERLGLRVTVAYLDVLRSQETLDLMRGQLKTIKDYRARIDNMVDEGAADRALAMQAQDIQAQLENTIADIEGQLNISRTDYRELTGHLPEAPMEMPAPYPELFEGDIERAVSFALENNATIKAAKSDAEAVGQDVYVEQASLFPYLNGELSYLERDQEDVIGGEVRDAKAVMRLNWNFSTGGGQIHRIRKTRQRHVESLAQEEAQRRQIEKEVRSAWYDMEKAETRLALFRERQKLNDELFRTNQKQFEAAKVNLLQLMQSDNTRFNAKIAVLNGEYRRMATQYKLLASVGMLQDMLGVAPAGKND